jgi:FAD dependent oxidoreductase
MIRIAEAIATSLRNCLSISNQIVIMEHKACMFKIRRIDLFSFANLFCVIAFCSGILFATPAWCGEPDVIVYGSTPGGIAAAVAAAKGGHQVMLIEPTTRLGGMLSNGLSHSDFRSFESLSGFFLDFSERVLAHYRTTYGADSAQVQACWRGAHGEPSVNLKILEQMISELPNIRVQKELLLSEIQTSSFQLGRRKILSATFVTANSKPVRLTAKIFIDGTYEGDLMALAGESFHVGRESRAQYGEPLAGDENGQADGQVQGYNFRLCMTQVETNKLLPNVPPNYRREDFTGLLQLINSGKLKKIFDTEHAGVFRAHKPLLPNGKADVNDAPNAPVRLSMPDINDNWPTGNQATRQQIFQEHVYYHQGLLYFLQTDVDVPKAIQAEALAWGWCKDEFIETNGIPSQLYVREGRRLVGQHVFTAKDTCTVHGDSRSVLHTDSIAMGDYIHNCHGTGRKGTRFEGEHVGQFFDFVQPYQIPYGVIVPQITDNMLVPVACSASHFGFGALRLEPIWCSLGQAAGWAAHLAIEGGTSVQRVDVATLQSHLHLDKSASIYVSDVPPSSPDFAAIQWWGNRGGFHKLVQKEEVPKPKNIIDQYFEAFPDHAAELAIPLNEEVRNHWEKILPSGLRAAERVTSRGEWIRDVFNGMQRRHLPAR